MINRVNQKYSMDEMLALLDPLLQEWFRSKFAELTPPQAYTVPLIHQGKNVLVSSPTGSGKTITAFLSIINELYLLQKGGKLENKIYCVYISPLKALANDINRNLETPLKELRELAVEKGVEPPEIRVAVRSGDTSSYQRAKMVRKPPHIFITTPESMSLVLSTTKFSERFHHVRYLIIDEIHELTNSKRGVMLSLSMERLESLIVRSNDSKNSEKTTPTRIGLSATQAPIKDIARFLVGYQQGNLQSGKLPDRWNLQEHDGKLKDVNIVEVTKRKPLDLKVICPVDDMNQLPFEVVNARMYDQLAELIRDHTTTLVFTNTRSATEAVVYKLQEKGIRDIAAHHGSLSKETRLEVEENLKEGNLKVVVSSTSLELGIDIGSVDLVVQLNSPKTVAKGLQRIGRAGHGVYDTSKGRIIVFDRDDLLECAVLTKYAYDGFIDRINILHNSRDVLAQVIVGLSLEKKWQLRDVYELVTRAYPYRSMDYETFLGTVRYVGAYNSSDYMYSKVWLDEEGKTIGIKKGSRMIYNMNLGTIPQESSFRVMLRQRGLYLGSLSEKFVEKLEPGDIFVLGGKTYEFVETAGTRVVVVNAHGRKPTVPSWTGEMLPRSYDLSVGVGKFRGYVGELVKSGIDRREMEGKLIEEYRLDRGSARTVVNYISEQISIVSTVPSEKQLLVEGFLDERGRRNLIFHFPFGRRVNDALSRAYARVISEKLSSNVRISLNDDSFMLTFSHRIQVEGTADFVKSREINKLLRSSIRYTELFKQRFRHCANRGFMILRNYMGREIPMGKQRFRSVRILDAIHHLKDHPLVLETYNEILHDVMDVDNAVEVLRNMESGKIKVEYVDYHEIPSPLAHNIVLMGISDIVLMEDRSALLRELHKKVLATAFSQDEFRYRLSRVEEYFKEKKPLIEGKEDIPKAVKQLQPLNLFIEKGRCIHDYSDVERKKLHDWCFELVKKGVLESVYVGRELWALSEDVKEFRSLYSVTEQLQPGEKEILDSIPEEAGEENKEHLINLASKLSKRKDLLHKFRKGYLIKSDFVDKSGDPQKIYLKNTNQQSSEYESSLDRAVIRYLELFAPSNLEELSYRLSLGQGIIKQAVEELVEKGRITGDAFVIGKLTPQYMLVKDVEKLDNISQSNYLTFKEEILSIYLHHKHKTDTIDQYFDLFGFATTARTVFQHTKYFSPERWKEIMESEVIQGRFVRHRVCFVRLEDVSLYASAYRDTESLEPLDLRILEFIKKNPLATRRMIMNSQEASPEMVDESIGKLDYTLNIIRLPEPVVGGEYSTANRYAAIGKYIQEDVPYPIAKEELILRHLKAFGPTTIRDLRRNTMFSSRDIERLLTKNSDVVEKITVLGDVEMVMYTHKDDLEELQKCEKESPGIKIHSRTDPSIRHLMHEIRSRFGEGWYSPVVNNGRPVGVVIHWKMSSAIDVRNILLEDGFLEDNAGALAKALEGFMEFYRKTGQDLLRIRKINNKQIKKLPQEIIKTFTDKGFSRIHSWLISGKILQRTYEKKDIFSYIFHKQHLHKNSLFTSTIEAVRKMGGIRDNQELQLRLRNPAPLQVSARRLKLVTGIALPSYLLTMTEKQAGIYQKAKNVKPDRDMKEILNSIHGKMHYKEIYLRTSLSPSKFKPALKKLRNGQYVVKLAMNYYKRIKSSGMSTNDARNWVLKNALDSLGLVKPERLYRYLKGDFRMSEIRNFLSQMEKENYLVKGFLSKDDDDLYYLLATDIKEITKRPFNQEFVLSPKDRLFHYLSDYIRDKFKTGACHVVFRGTRVTGIFKTRKSGRQITIRNFIGGKEEKRIIQYWGSVNNFILSWES